MFETYEAVQIVLESYDMPTDVCDVVDLDLNSDYDYYDEYLDTVMIGAVGWVEFFSFQRIYYGV